MNTTNTTTSDSRRAAATEQYERAKAAITGVFDAVDELRSVLAAIALSSTGSDPLRGSLDIEETLPRLRSATSALRQAAASATPYAPKSELAAHADTKTGHLFPRADTPPSPSAPSPHPSPVFRVADESDQ